MNPPARPIRQELSDAIVRGIRERGAEAVGLILIGTARLILAIAVLLMLHLFGSAVFGFNLASVPFAAISVLSIALSTMATWGYQWGSREEPEAPTQDEVLTS